MSDAPAPIELARRRPATARRALRGIRTVARSLHLALTVAIILGVFVQVYLIGAYIFGAGQGLLVVLSLAATLAVRNFRRLRDAAPAARS
jgi:hypothetical protein